MDNERGPSWNDCAAVIQVIIGQRIRTCQVGVAVALPRVYGKGYSAWTFTVRSEPLQGRVGPTVVTRASWGSGGAWKSAPAALHRALSEAVERLEEYEAQAMTQQRF